MHCNITHEAELKLKKTSSSEILTFTYNVNNGLDTRMSSHTSVPRPQDSVYYETAIATCSQVVKKNMYNTSQGNNKKFLFIN